MCVLGKRCGVEYNYFRIACMIFECMLSGKERITSGGGDVCVCGVFVYLMGMLLYANAYNASVYMIFLMYNSVCLYYDQPVDKVFIHFPGICGVCNHVILPHFSFFLLKNVRNIVIFTEISTFKVLFTFFFLVRYDSDKNVSVCVLLFVTICI